MSWLVWRQHRSQALFALLGLAALAAVLVPTGLQVAAKVGEAEALGASFQVAGVAVVDRKPAVDDQLPRCLRW
jgi:hypothetical protein